MCCFVLCLRQRNRSKVLAFKKKEEHWTTACFNWSSHMIFLSISFSLAHSCSCSFCLLHIKVTIKSMYLRWFIMLFWYLFFLRLYYNHDVYLCVWVCVTRTFFRCCFQCPEINVKNLSFIFFPMFRWNMKHIINN